MQVEYLMYQIFKEDVILKSRYVYNDYTKSFLSIFKNQLKYHEVILDSNEYYFRAQKGASYKRIEESKGYFIDKPFPYDNERMKPLIGKSKEGRVNPKGIPCLYLCNDIETCIMETRPWLKELLTIGYFKINENLKFVQFSEIGTEKEINQLSEKELELNLLWSDIDDAFSYPIQNDDDSALYTPTQILSEIVKSNGYDGIIYKSSLGVGKNIAIFELDKAFCEYAKVYEVHDLSCFASECK